MKLNRIIVTRKLPDAVEARLKDHFTVALNTEDTAFSNARLVQALQNADGLLCAITDTFDAMTLGAAGRRRTRILANFGVGVSNIDIVAAKKAMVVVTNTPDVLTDATADLAIALMLSVTRRMSQAEAILRSGSWHGFSPTGFLGTGLQGKTLGIVGMGRIGQATARRAHLGFGMNILYYNRSPAGPFFEYPATPATSIEEVMSQSDVVSLHIPGGPDNAGLISAEVIAPMKPDACLINTARGDVIDEAALIEALQQGRIAGAGLDVFAHEPDVPPALAALPNVTLLPHIGSATIETRTAMGMLAVDNLIAFFSGKPPPARVV
jgi:lactate dehydrogenase-like 2-hydroxyacid dehydrogenase